VWYVSSVYPLRSRNSSSDLSQVATPVSSTVSMRGPMSSQISDHTTAAGLPRAHGYFFPRVSRR
jgi:hypothetical protein